MCGIPKSIRKTCGIKTLKKLRARSQTQLNWLIHGAQQSHDHFNVIFSLKCKSWNGLE